MNHPNTAFYNEITDSVDIRINQRITLRVDCKTVFSSTATTQTSCERMIQLSHENPRLFAELVLDHLLESYLNALE